MYNFQTNAGRRKARQTARLLKVVIFVLVIALAGVTYSFVRARGVEHSISDALYARVVSEAGEAQSVIYRLTQSSGANTASLLAAVRSHIYALQSLNTLAAGIYGPGTTLSDAKLLASCIDTLNECEQRLQAGLVITDLYTDLRDDIDRLVSAFTVQ